MAGLRPAIHVFLGAKTWMPGTGPGMTKSADSRRTFTTSPRHAPEPLINLPPKEGVGNAGCPMHPRLVCNDSGRTHTSNNEYTGITRHPRTQCLTVSFVLSR